MSGQLWRELSADVFSGGIIQGTVNSTTVTSSTIQTSSTAYVSSGTANLTTVSTAASQIADTAITWPGFDPVGGQVLTAADASGQLTWATGLTTADPLLSVAQRIRVKQNPGVGEFLFIADALASITDASASKPYIVDVGPGLYTEGGLTVPAYVDVKGMSQSAVVVVPIAGAHAFLLGDNSGLENLTISGATSSGFAGVALTSAGKCFMGNLTVQGTDVGFLMDASGSDSISCVASDLVSSNIQSTAVLVRSTGSATSKLTLEGFEFGDTLTGVTEIVMCVDGSNAELVGLSVDLTLLAGETPYGTALVATNGGTLRCIGANINRFALGVSAPADGGTPHLDIEACDFSETTQSTDVANPNAEGHYFSDIPSRSLVVIHPDASFRISGSDNREVTVAGRGGDFSTIGAAVAYVTSQTPTVSAPWMIRVGAGTFSESNPIVIPSFVSVQGSGITTSLITATDANSNLFEVSASTYMSHMATLGPSNAAAVSYAGSALDERAYVTDFTFGGYQTAVKIRNTDGLARVDLVQVYSTISLFDGSVARSFISAVQSNTNRITLRVNTMRCAIPVGEEATGTPPYTSFTAIEFVGFAGASRMRTLLSSLSITQRALAAGTVGVGLSFENVNAELADAFVVNYATAIHLPASTLNTKVGVASISTQDNIRDVLVENNNCTGAMRLINGALSKIDVSAAPSHGIAFSIEGGVAEGVTFTGPVNMGHTVGSVTAMLPSIQHSGTTTGLLTGGALTLTGGLGIQVAPGDGYVTGTADGNPTYVEWSGALSDTLATNSDQFVSVTSAGAVQLTSSPPSVYAAILIARVKSDATGIVFVENISTQALHTATLLDTTLREAFGPIVASGMIGSAGTAAFQLNVSSGNYFYSTHEYSPSGGADITFTPLFHSSGVFVSGPGVNVLSAGDARRYDNGTDLVALGGGNWVKHALYVLNDGTHEKYLFIYGQTEFASQSAAENGALPLQPSFVGENFAGVSGLVVGDASTDWVTVQDIRATLQFTAAGVTATTDHGSLTGLLDDDHTQYLLSSGSRAMAGALDLNSNNITNPGTIDGVTITDMSGRLRPGGADEIPTAAGVTLTALTNGVGASTSLARADHTHAHGVQVDATLHGAATGGVNGFMPGSDKTKLDASTSASTVSTLVERDGSGSINLTGLVVDGNGSVQLANSGDTFHVSVQAPAALGADYTLTLPANDGDNLQFLQTDGAGVTSWVAGGGGLSDPMTTAGDVIIRNAANATDRLAIGTEPNQVLTVGATGVPAWQSAGAARDPSISPNVVFLDDFMFAPALRWRVSGSDHSLPYDLGEGNALGIAQLTTVSGSNANSTGMISGNISLRGGLGSMSVKMRVLFQELSAGGQTSEVSLGLGDTPVDNTSSLAITDGAFFYLSDDAAVQIRTAAGASLTSQATSPLQTVVVDTWYKAELVVSANGAGTWTSIEFLWDDVSVGTITTNLPNAVSQPFGPQVYIRKTAGNTAHAMLIDYYYLNYELVSVR
jgi:hypothetical protein